MTATGKSVVAAGVAALLLVAWAASTAPPKVGAADHLDAPGLMSPGGDPRLDINDVYVFQGADPGNTVLAMTVNPVAVGDTTFAEKHSGSYHLRIDTNGDAIEDVTYSISFETDDGNQIAKVQRAQGRTADTLRPRGRVVAAGPVGEELAVKDGGSAWTGLRSDPFFFDLGGFLGTVEGIGNRMLNDGEQSDFFADLNTLAIVLEVPDEQLGGTIGVWGTTSVRNGGAVMQNDRMGRPAINTVVNSSGPIVQAATEAKNLFNGSAPRNDGAFAGAVISALQAYSSLDTEGAYTDGEAGALAGVLLPDVIIYDTATAAAGPLNGRALADDVIDIELRIVTGGDPLGLFPDRDALGAINTDGVGPHDDYLDVFPYLGEPNS